MEVVSKRVCIYPDDSAAASIEIRSSSANVYTEGTNINATVFQTRYACTEPRGSDIYAVSGSMSKSSALQFTASKLQQRWRYAVVVGQHRYEIETLEMDPIQGKLMR